MSKVNYVTNQGEYIGGTSSIFTMIDNYIYMYHTDTLIILPTFPETLQDTTAVSYASTSILARSAPIYSYSSSGPRAVNFNLHLHRDMLNQVNTSKTKFPKRTVDPYDRTKNILDNDYIDLLTNQLQAAALPKYASGEKMVDPPIVAVRFGNQLFCKGVVNGQVGVEYTGPILSNDKYAEVNIAFTIDEIDPYDASTVMLNGSFRGLNMTLERNEWVGA